MAEHCAKCKRRMMVTWNVADDVKRLVLLNRWKAGVCADCFDELAEAAGVRYSFLSAEAISWSDRAPRRPPQRG